jgi:hypothetical protein
VQRLRAHRVGMPPNDPLVPDPPQQRFLLTVQPESPRQPWHALLCTVDGERIAFASPIELLRHLVALGRDAPPPGHLK